MTIVLTPVLPSQQVRRCCHTQTPPIIGILLLEVASLLRRPTPFCLMTTISRSWVTSGAIRPPPQDPPIFLLHAVGRTVTLFPVYSAFSPTGRTPSPNLAFKSMCQYLLLL